MLGLLALEAWRHQAIVVGENLGTVPDGFNQGLQEKGMLGMSVLWFQRGVQADAAGSAASFTAPSQWTSDRQSTRLKLQSLMRTSYAVSCLKKKSYHYSHLTSHTS